MSLFLSESTGTQALAAAMQEAGSCLEVLAVARTFDDPLARDLLQRHAGAGREADTMLGRFKALPFFVRVDPRRWAIQPVAREALLASLRRHRNETFADASRFVAEYLEREARGEGRRAREARWEAALQWLPVDQDRALDHMLALADGATGLNRRVDLDVTAALAESSPELMVRHKQAVAYLIGLRAHAHGDQATAASQFQRVMAESAQPRLRAVASHALAQLLLEGSASDARAAGGYARESLRLRREHGLGGEAAAELTLAQALARGMPVPSEEVIGILDDAIAEFEATGDGRAVAVGRIERARFFLARDRYDEAIGEAQRAQALSRGRYPRELVFALKLFATSILRAVQRGVRGTDELRRVEAALVESEVVSGAPNFDLRSRLAEARGDLDGAIQYAERALTATTREREVHHLEARLRSLRRRMRRADPADPGVGR